MHPTDRICAYLGYEGSPNDGIDHVEMEDNWRFIHCVLDLIREVDPRPQQVANPVQDIYMRMREAGIEENTDAFLLMRQRLSQTYEHFARRGF